VSRQTRRKGCRKSVIQMSYQLRKSALLADPGWLQSGVVCFPGA